MILTEVSRFVGVGVQKGGWLILFICSFSFEVEMWVLFLLRLCSQITSHFLLLLLF